MNLREVCVLDEFVHDVFITHASYSNFDISPLRTGIVGWLNKMTVLDL